MSFHHPFCHPMLQGLSWVGICKGKIQPLFVGGAPAALQRATLGVQIAAKRKMQSSVFWGAFPTGTASRNPFLLERKVLCENKKEFLLHFGLRPPLSTLVTTGFGISSLCQSLEGQARAPLWPGGLSDEAPGGF